MLAGAAIAAGLLAAAGALTAVGLAGPRAAHVYTGPRAAQVYTGLDRGLCSFPLQVTVRTTGQSDQPATSALEYTFAGPSTITLRNTRTGRTAKLVSSGPYTADTRTGNVAFRGHQVWFWWTAGHVPFASTDGAGSLVAPNYVLAPGSSRARVIDPCALLASSKPSTRPATTKGPWGLPAYPLSQIGYAGLVPVIGNLVRHDHVHLDVLVNGRPVTIPAGVGQAEPVDHGACPPSTIPVGDCTSGHVFAAAVANSPIHTHSTSGIVHIEPDRRGTYTLGQFFDEWGVRLTPTCLGGYCAGDGKQLRVFVNGKRVGGNPRGIAFGNRQEIAIVFGSRRDFRSVPSSYEGGWPGLGCGGAGEHPC